MTNDVWSVTISKICMSFKTKLFSLIIVGLLLLPIFISPQKTGQVLGTREGVQPEVSSNPQPGSQITSNTESKIQNDTLRQAKVGEIGSGIRDVKSAETQAQSPVTFKGKAIWDANAKSSVATDKFSLGSGIKVVRGGKTLDLVVGSGRVLATDTILVLDKKSFVGLGGNPETDNQIEVEVWLDQ